MAGAGRRRRRPRADHGGRGAGGTASLTTSCTTSGTTYYDQPLVKEPVWVWSVPVYFSVGGVAGAAAVLAAVADTLGGPELGRLVRRARWTSAAGSVVGGALLVHDLGRRARFLNMLRTFRATSPLSVGSWTLLVHGGASWAAAVPGPWPRRLAGRVAGVTGLVMSGYTAVLLTTTAVPVWRASRRTLPWLFVASSASATAALLELVENDPSEEAALRALGIAGAIGELVGTAAVLRESNRVSGVARAYRTGLSGAMLAASVAAGAAGLAVALTRPRRRSMRAFGSALSLAGAAGVKLAVFRAGWPSAHSSRPTRTTHAVTARPASI